MHFQTFWVNTKLFPSLHDYIHCTFVLFSIYVIGQNTAGNFGLALYANQYKKSLVESTYCLSANVKAAWNLIPNALEPKYTDWGP